MLLVEEMIVGQAISAVTAGGRYIIGRITDCTDKYCEVQWSHRDARARHGLRGRPGLPFLNKLPPNPYDLDLI